MKTKYLKEGQQFPILKEMFIRAEKEFDLPRLVSFNSNDFGSHMDIEVIYDNKLAFTFTCMNNTVLNIRA